METEDSGEIEETLVGTEDLEEIEGFTAVTNSDSMATKADSAAAISEVATLGAVTSEVSQEIREDSVAMTMVLVTAASATEEVSTVGASEAEAEATGDHSISRCN